ncbi:hypothetical protein [Streptomyces adelaidensis]|uniref:hypothetical protein n=1 Tax=Streptomyces adelaidensis TaxID=2796465 RepID=UPI0019058132|nr:hypothetical protein [Streptomyces adelaidensis]
MSELARATAPWPPSIHPFELHIPQAALDDLAARLDATVRRLAERDHNIVHWSELPRGGHFAALEQPELFTTDVRMFFRRFRRLR